MPLGDSITEITCWREYLWQHLTDAQLTDKVNLVGSKNDTWHSCTMNVSGFDRSHEGHRGWTASRVVDYLQKWLWSAATPDVVQFMLGTNDIYQGRTNNEILDSYTSLVQIMRKTNPNMKIIVSSWQIMSIIELTQSRSTSLFPCLRINPTYGF